MPNFRAKKFNNEAREDSDKVLKYLNKKDNYTIADIGSGGGFFVFEFARITGGKVYAVDTDSLLLDNITKQAEKENVKNVKLINAKEDDPMLPPESCNLIFMRNVFHHIMNPESYFQRLKESLKPGGRIAIIDWKPEARHGHGTPEEEILSVLESAGFRRTETYGFLEKLSFNIFKAVTV